MYCQSNSPKNVYFPYAMKTEKVIEESPDKDLKTFVLSFINKEDAKRFKYTPGQFAQASVFGVGEAPFGIASAPMEENIYFSVKKVGQLTTALHMTEAGDVVGLRGPFGNGWPLEDLKGKNIVVIGGGFAFTTLRSLVRYILEPDNRRDFEELTVVYGARNPGQLLYKEELKEWQKRDDLNLHLTIDKPVDGWDGKVGFVPAVTEEVVTSSQNAVALVCGPPIMIKFTLPVLKKLGFTSEAILTSLEMKMKCGVGMCGRCNIGSQYVCIDGPVFSMAELEKLPNEY